MQLRDLRPSLLDLSQEEEYHIHREIRKSRMVIKEAKSKAKSKTIKKTTKAQSEIRKDPEKIKQLLALLEEED